MTTLPSMLFLVSVKCDLNRGILLSVLQISPSHFVDGFVARIVISKIKDCKTTAFRKCEEDRGWNKEKYEHNKFLFEDCLVKVFLQCSGYFS
ncbi:hypothetical protein TorRG33x02_174790 [Trema orientale]|uniref:Uncharacterized protein n=1 Tax=Trema orientale TaxID=63057 RepID=A0A2P5EML3_TREOI|nr:hypothetical protein TorRG33x02_174790 [Trema orientale]